MGPQARPGGPGSLLPATEGARGAGRSGSRYGVGTGSNSCVHAGEESGSGAGRGEAQTHGDDHSRRFATGTARGLSGGVLLGRAGFRTVLVRREAKSGGSDPPDGTGDG